MVLGPVVKGGFEGIGNYFSQKEADKSQRERDQRISGSYEGAGAASRVGDIAGGIPLSSGRWQGGKGIGREGTGSYQFNDQTGAYEFVEDQA